MILGQCRCEWEVIGGKYRDCVTNRMEGSGRRQREETCIDQIRKVSHLVL